MQAAEKRRIAATDPDGGLYAGRYFGDPVVELSDDPFVALAEWERQHAVTAATPADAGREEISQ